MAAHTCRVVIRTNKILCVFNGRVIEDICHLRLVSLDHRPPGPHQRLGGACRVSICCETLNDMAMESVIAGLVYPDHESIWTRATSEEPFVFLFDRFYDHPIAIVVKDATSSTSSLFTINLMWDTRHEHPYAIIPYSRVHSQSAQGLGLTRDEHAVIQTAFSTYWAVVPMADSDRVMAARDKCATMAVHMPPAPTHHDYRRTRLGPYRANVALRSWLGLLAYRGFVQSFYATPGLTYFPAFEAWRDPTHPVPSTLRNDYQRVRASLAAYACGPESSRFHSCKQTTIDGTTVRVYVPRGSFEGRCLVFAHAGGFVLGDETNHHNLLADICGFTRCLILSVRYPLAHEDPFPAPVHTVQRVLSWLRADGGKRLLVDPGRIGLMGISAGATIMSIVAFEDAKARPKFPIKFQFLWSPIVELHPTAEGGLRRGVRGLTQAEILEHLSLSVAPDRVWRDTYFDAGLLSTLQLAPTYFHSPEQDCLHEEGMSYVQHLRRCGHSVEFRVWPGVPHNALEYALVPPVGDIVVDVVCDVRDAFER